MKVLKIIVNIYIFFFILIKIISTTSLPKCCQGSESFGVNIYSLGTSCSDMINCCPSGTLCTKKGNCIRNKKIKRKLKKYKNKKEEDINKIEPEKEKKQKKSFNGPVRINWKSLNGCLLDSKSKEPIIKEIIDNYKNNKEKDAMKIVFSELKKENPVIIECLNKQEHLK